MWAHRKEENLEDLKKEPADAKLRRYKSNWIRHVTRTNSSRMLKTMLNYRSNGRRRLGRPLKIQLGDAKTSPLQSKTTINLFVSIKHDNN